ncbi:unnamed protein product [Diatraea saccharalis]|nr:unnamed protein product [Diatraea saccharalis]
MRFSILLVLSALAIIQASVINAPTSRANLNVGYVTAGDRLLYSTYVSRPAMVNAVQRQDLVYRGSIGTRISAINATEVGVSQFASAWVIAGGIRANNVTIRFQSAVGRGYYYNVNIWGR